MPNEPHCEPQGHPQSDVVRRKRESGYGAVFPKLVGARGDEYLHGVRGFNSMADPPVALAVGSRTQDA